MEGTDRRMDGTNKPAFGISAEAIIMLLGTRIAVLDPAAAAENKKVEIKGAQPATTGAVAQMLPGFETKVIMKTYDRASREYRIDGEHDAERMAK